MSCFDLFQLIRCQFFSKYKQSGDESKFENILSFYLSVFNKKFFKSMIFQITNFRINFFSDQKPMYSPPFSASTMLFAALCEFLLIVLSIIFQTVTANKRKAEAQTAVITSRALNDEELVC